VTPPSPAAQVRALAELSGVTPDPGARRDVAMLMMITTAKQRGVTWAQIASATGHDSGPAAKAAAKRMARTAQQAVLAMAWQSRGAGDGGA
jgi:hypothetical protein